MEKNTTIQKIISFVIIISIIAPSVLLYQPKKAEAIWAGFISDLFAPITSGSSAVVAGEETAQTALKFKDIAKEIMLQIIRTVTRRFLQQMTKSTVNWINSGFHGSPLFLENPGSFFKDIVKYEIKTMVDMFGYDPNKFPFGKDFALNTISSYKTQLTDNAAYSLNKVMTEPQAREFRNNFNAGGWNGFLINTQYPQNNYLGFQMIATEALAKKLQGTTQNAAQKVQATLQQGMGFLSPQTCADNNGNNEYNKVMANQFQRPSFNDAEYDRTHPCDANEGGNCFGSGGSLRWDEAKKAAKAEWAKKNTCKNLVATTPGSVVASQITTAMGSTFRQSELGAAMGNSISAVLDALLNKFLGEGLNALASKRNSTPAPDTWEYDGQKLGGPGDGTNSDWDAGPDEPVILTDFRKKIEGKTVTTGSVLLGTCTFGATTIDSITQAMCLGFSATARITNGGITTGETSWIANPTETTVTTEEVGNIHNCTYDKDLKKWCSSTAYTYIPGDIENTKAELQLIYNVSPTNPGIIQLLGLIWPKAQELDICQPGPDIKWKDRVLEELDRNSRKLSEEANKDTGEKSAKAMLVLKELKFAVNFFKDWVDNKMMLALPNSVIYMDAVEEIETLSQESDELTDKRRVKTQALARLRAIKLGLDKITTQLNTLPEKPSQPKAGSGEEEVMVSLYKQYKATSTAISNDTTVDNMFNELTIALEKFNNLNNLVTKCGQERVAAGWTGLGWNSRLISATNAPNTLPSTEKSIFCDAPIRSGYDHETFKHENDGKGCGNGFLSSLFNPIGPLVPTGFGGGGASPIQLNSEIPYVNAYNVLKWKGKLGLMNHCVSIKLNCNIIYKANILDYKGNLPGTTDFSKQNDLPLLEDDTPDGTSTGSTGTCVFHDGSPSESGEGVTEEYCTANEGSWTIADQTAIATLIDCDLNGETIYNIEASVCGSLGGTPITRTTPGTTP